MCPPCSGHAVAARCWTRRPRSEAAAPNLRPLALEPLACPGPAHSGPLPVRLKAVMRRRLLGVGWGGVGRSRTVPGRGTFILWLPGTAGSFQWGELRKTVTEGRGVACHPSDARAGSAVPECRASHWPWCSRVDARPMVLIYRFQLFRVHSSVAVRTLMRGGHHRCAVKGLRIAPNDNPTTPCAKQPLPLPLPSPRRPLTGLVSLDLPVPGVSYKRNHGTCGFLCPASFPERNISRASPCQRVSACPRFWWPNHVPLSRRGLA